MKWLYWHKTSPYARGLARDTWKERLKRIRDLKIGYNPQSSTWIFALEADATSSWEVIENYIEEYDAILLEYVNFGDSQQNPLGKMRTELCRKLNPNIIIVGSWDSWVGNPAAVRRQFKSYRDFQWVNYAVKKCDMIFTTSNLWEARNSGHSMMWNDIFNTDKFTYLLAPFDIEGLSKFHKTYEEREKHVISAGPVNYWQTNSKSAKVLQACLPSGWKAGLTHVRTRQIPQPFYKMGTLDWWNYVEWVSKSYMGVFNAVGGGLASVAGMGAVLKTPFVGSDTSDYLVKCFPELAFHHTEINKQVNVCRRLINDESFWREITTKGFKYCQEQLSFEGAKQQLYNELKRRELINV